MGESCLTSSQCVRPRGGDIPQPRLPQTSMFGDRNHQLCVNTLNLAACSSPTQQSCYHLSFVPRRFQSRDKDWIQCFVGCLVEPACQTPTACLFFKRRKWNKDQNRYLMFAFNPSLLSCPLWKAFAMFWLQSQSGINSDLFETIKHSLPSTCLGCFPSEQ